jgi:type II secretory ATPase GspE/PulE/Tfp pilus assembly ATPase PilB-like protein
MTAPSPAPGALVPEPIAREYGVVPLGVEAGLVVVAVPEGFSPNLRARLRFDLGCDIRCVERSRDVIARDIDGTYGALARLAAVTALPGEAAGDVDLGAARIVQGLLQEAAASRASDVHVEPLRHRVRIRFRIDGFLREAASLPKAVLAPIVTYIKVLAGIDIAERRLPQDGRARIESAGRFLDLRVSTLPASNGESAVIRLLDPGEQALSLVDLGLTDAELERFRSLARSQDGLIVVTGPTGCGKTTTINAALRELCDPATKIVTVEDPIEYQLHGVVQIPVSPKVGIDFARALRHILRHDPDVILVGEIRDAETARTALQASLTGHLVFSTLHTNDAPSAIVRLLKIGVEPFLVNAALKGIVAQRLVRRLCERCREESGVSPEEASRLGEAARLVGRRPVFRARGCASCQESGYRGRVGIFEMLLPSDRIRSLVTARRSGLTLRDAAGEEGFETLLEDGVRKCVAGRTSLAEVLRVCSG